MLQQVAHNLMTEGTFWCTFTTGLTGGMPATTARGFSAWPRQLTFRIPTTTKQRQYSMKITTSFWQVLLLLLPAAFAFSIELSSIRVNGNEPVQIGGEDASQQVFLKTGKDKVIVDVKLAGELEKKPQQMYFILTNNKGLDFTVFPEFHISSNTAKATIIASKIPPALQAEDKIYVEFLAADSNSKHNLLTPLFELVPLESLTSSVNFKPPFRLGALPEIHHIFKEDPKTVNAVIPLVFSSAAAALLVALFGAWATLVGDSLFGANAGSAVKGVFLSTLALFEVIFFRYYLRASIFTTLFHVAVVSGPSLFFGARALRALYHVRVTESA